VPILGVLALLYPLYAVSNPAASYPYNLVPIIVVIWIIVGIVLFFYYKAKSPEKIEALGSFVTEDDHAENVAK